MARNCNQAIKLFTISLSNQAISTRCGAEPFKAALLSICINRQPIVPVHEDPQMHNQLPFDLNTTKRYSYFENSLKAVL